MKRFKMFKLLSFLVLGTVVKVESEQIQCQMIPIKTENGIAGHCCMFLKDTSSEDKRERLIEQIFKNRRVLKHLHKPSDGSIRFEGGHPPPGFKPPPPDEPMMFLDNDRDRYMGERYGVHRKQVLHVRVHSSYPHPIPPKLSDGTTPLTTDEEASRVSFSQEDNSSGEIMTISAETTDTTIESESGENSTDKVVELDNRFNINAPKTCTGDSKKTSTGECETAFG